MVDQWEMLTNSINIAAKTTIPKLKTVGRKKWITEEILRLMETSRHNKNNAEYEEIHRKVRKLCKEAKEAWLENNCIEIEKQLNSKNTKLMHKRDQELTNKRPPASTSSLKKKMEKS